MLKNSILIPVFSLLILASCNISFNKVLKSNDMEYKAEMADKYYAKKDYDKAIQLYEELLTFYKGQKNVEPYYYNYAMSHYGNKDFLMAGFYFNQFVINYPRSPLAEDAAFKVAECYEKQSPKFELDQSNTIDAINKYQSFVNKYPNSKLVENANAAIDVLREKLHKKAFASAYLYYKIREYNAAAVSFKSVMREYPDMAEIEKVRYFVIKSLKLYADNSLQAKKAERYTEAIKEFEAFKADFPNSQYLDELEKLNNASLHYIQSQENNQTSHADGKEKRRN